MTVSSEINVFAAGREGSKGEKKSVKTVRFATPKQEDDLVSR